MEAKVGQGAVFWGRAKGLMEKQDLIAAAA